MEEFFFINISTSTRELLLQPIVEIFLSLAALFRGG
jgi:hypothetical protein